MNTQQPEKQSGFNIQHPYKTPPSGQLTWLSSTTDAQDLDLTLCPR